MKLVIGHFYPELLNLYGDKGNITVLEKRAKWRDIEVEIKEFGIMSEPDFSDIDIAVIGGGSEREQLIVLEKLKTISEDIKNYVENNGVLLAVCGGFRMLGSYCYLNGEKMEGLDILDMYTEKGEKRYTENTVLESEFGKIAGFESHFGKTYTGELPPLGTVVCGCGNNKEDKKEGVIYKNLIGTNLHGPLLPKNPELADYIIKTALERKYNQNVELKELDDTTEKRAKVYIVNKYTREV